MNNDKIFIAIASLLDPELPITINDCIIKADNPENLSFGVCLQYDNDRKEVAEDILDFYADKFDIRIKKYHWTKSKGGCWARQIVQTLHEDEHYHLQIDSHSRLVKGWDTKCKKMLNDLKEKSPKPFITMLPQLYERNYELGVDTYSYLDKMNVINVPIPQAVTAQSWIEYGGYHNPQILKEPQITLLLYGGFIFSESNWIKDIEQDPEHYYAGEEFALMLRSFTHGYDCYLPNEILAWHIANGSIVGIPHHFEVVSKDNGGTEHNNAMLRFQRLLNNEDLGKYSLGKERTISEYEKLLNVDLKNGILL